MPRSYLPGRPWRPRGRRRRGRRQRTQVPPARQPMEDGDARPRPYEASTGTPSTRRWRVPRSSTPTKYAPLSSSQTLRTLPGFSSSPTGAQTILSTRSASKAATWGTGSSHARASSAALQESSRVALTPFIDVDDQRDASVKRGSSFVGVSSTAAISEFSLSQIFFAEGPPSVLRGRGPPSGIFVALIDDARRLFSLSKRGRRPRGSSRCGPGASRALAEWAACRRRRGRSCASPTRVCGRRGPDAPRRRRPRRSAAWGRRGHGVAVVCGGRPSGRSAVPAEGDGAAFTSSTTFVRHWWCTPISAPQRGRAAVGVATQVSALVQGHSAACPGESAPRAAGRLQKRSKNVERPLSRLQSTLQRCSAVSRGASVYPPYASWSFNAS